MIQLSIIVPVYNKVKYLDECIQSILAQTFTDFELILVNDGSTDGSDLICERHAQADPRVLLIQQANAGVSAARNAGLEVANGNYIGFIDSDDSVENDMYELLMTNILKYDADVSVCRLQTLGPGKVERPHERKGVRVFDRREALASSLNGELDRSANNKIYKSEFAKAVEFEGSINEDILYTNRVFLKSSKTVVEDVVKYNYMVRDNSASMQSFNEAYSQMIDISAKIMAMVGDSEPACLEEARAYDVFTNLSLLNLILLAGRSKTPALYQQIEANLAAYREFTHSTKLLNTKQRYAIILFQLSPLLYKSLLYAYCRISKADVVRRTSG